LVSAETAADLLGLARKTVYKLISERKLAAYKTSPSRHGKLLLAITDIEAYRARLIRMEAV